jgi:PKD repeat protein
MTGSQPGPVIYNEPGQYTVTLKVSNALGRDSVKLTLKVFDWPQGMVSENRIVPSRPVYLSDKSSEQPVGVNWTVDGANPSKYTGSGPIELSLPQPGEYSTEQIVEFSEFIDTLVHYNRIKVIQDNIAFRSCTFSNVASTDHTGYLSLGTQGYFPGSNSSGITAYAEAFRNASDTAFMITGLTIQMEKVSRWASNYYLPVAIWNSQRQTVLRDSAKIGNLRDDSKLTVWFKSPVRFDTLVYGGFEVRPWDQGTFYSKMAIDRGSKGTNTAYAVKGTQWSPMTDIAGVHTSLDVQLETAYLRNSYAEEIQIVPNGNQGEFTLDLGKLVFKSVLVDVYSLSGQKIVSQTERNENQIRLSVNPPVSGIYLVRVTLDDLSLTKKVLVMRKP